MLIRSSSVVGVCVLLLAAGMAALAAESTPRVAAIIALAGVVASVAYSAYRNGLVSGPTLFLALLGVFHLGMVVPIFVFGSPLPLMPHRWLEWMEVPVALSLFILATGGFLAGAIIGQGWAPEITEVRNLDPLSGPSYRILVVIYLIAAVGYAVFGVKSGILVGLDRGAILELRQSGGAIWFGFFRQWLVIACVGLVAFGSYAVAFFSVILTLFLFLPIFLVGDRGFFIVTAAAFLVVLKMKGVSFSRLTYLIIGSLVFLLIPILRNVRGGVESFASGFLDPFYEMGLQLRVVLFVIDAVEKGLWGGEYGGTYLAALGRALPNIGPIRELFGGAIESSPSYIITELYNSGGSGLGMSVVAEAYVNFGRFGALFVPFILGAALVLGERFGRVNEYLLVVYGAAMGATFFLVRGDFFGVSRPLMWALMLALTLYIADRSARR